LLSDAHTELLDALAAFGPDLADAVVPLPFGPLPAMLALQIVPIEYGFHHNDLLHALGADTPIPADVAAALIAILPGLLVVLAGGSAVGQPGQIPAGPMAYRLASPGGSVTLSFDGHHWSPAEKADDECRIEGDDSAIALFAMGRIVASDARLRISDPARAARFKAWFPGP
jgi:hypothetical protein